jgi:NhaP-type Na+/H+ or K+/H+ antiporter
VRFTLTAEAGLNDGLAFPFVNLAVAIAAHGSLPGPWLLEWAAVDVAWKLGAGIAVGWAVGQALGWLTFRVPNRAGLSRTGEGFVAIGVTFLAYGLAELAHGYGFLAVFVAALAIRTAERQHDYHERLHDFADQSERLLMMVLLVLFGGALAGGLLAPLTWAGAGAALLFLFVVRPAAGLVALVGAGQPMAERATIAFFGIRGLGSFYYLGLRAERGAFRGGGGALGGARLHRAGLHRAARHDGDPGHAPPRREAACPGRPAVRGRLGARPAIARAGAPGMAPSGAAEAPPPRDADRSGLLLPLG